jgi:hypothetical protein
VSKLQLFASTPDPSAPLNSSDHVSVHPGGVVPPLLLLPLPPPPELDVEPPELDATPMTEGFHRCAFVPLQS